VLEAESLAQHIPPIEGPSDAQQSSAAIWGQTRQGHNAKKRQNTIPARRPRWSRRSAEVTSLCITLRPNVAMMQLIYRTVSPQTE
jgi:hypothetical protein